MRDKLCYSIIILALWLTCLASAALRGYSGLQDTRDGQFHVQTDEGGDRYFIYQTDNGQYRKERRLRDGSVVGTTGWVDAAGYLRLQDYIADDQGYRIYKSKTVYVGPDTSIADSLQIAKSAPPDAGYGATPASVRTIAAPHRSAGTPRPPTSPAPVFPLEVSVTPPPVYRTSPHTLSVDISPNSIHSSDSKLDFRPTIAPITAEEASSSSGGDDNSLGYGSTTPAIPFRLDFNPNSYRHSGEWRRRVGTSKIRYTPPNNYVGDGYTPQFPTYDGNSLTTRGGFRYYLPKHYHEEHGDKEDGAKTGSFGYIDPFGIRRVIYYNADPGSGFQIRKNNRYVGHDATPYDPRPV